MAQSFLHEFEDREDEFEVRDQFVHHPNLESDTVRYREFQLRIARKCLKANTLIVLPTGLGKTYVALLTAAELLPEKVLLVAPSKPLVLQHYNTFNNCLKGKVVDFLTGDVKPEERKSVWNAHPAIIATPQTVRNDLENDRYSLNHGKLLIFDEAHKAVGDYAYTDLAEQFNSRIVGLTASPGGKRKRIREIMDNLKINQVEARARTDEDVRDWVKEIDVSYRTVELSEGMKQIQGLLQDYLMGKIKKLNELGFLTYKEPEHLSKTDIIKCRKRISQRFKRTKKKYLFGAFHNQATALQAYHVLELLETQGLQPMEDYLQQLEESDGRAKKSFRNDDRIEKVLRKAGEIQGPSHPKLEELESILESQFNEKGSLALVFTQYRKTIGSIQEACDKVEEVTSERFVGQSGEKGLSQDEQAEVLDRFETGRTNLLICTSIAEEGISIPDVDLVVFYEPIPSEIRAIQRRGRTGRTSIGKVEILITRDSRDEAYLHAQREREKKMNEIVGWLKER